MQAKKFTNWTTEDFTWKFDGIEYTFKAGETMFLEDFKADHFARHLVDREMNKTNTVTSMMNVRNELMAKCFPTDEVVTPLEALQINETAKPKKKEVEKEFEDLEEEEELPAKKKK